MKKKTIIKVLRSPLWPAIFSAFIAPGTGQIMNGDLKKGLFLMVSGLGSVYWFLKVVGERLALIVPGGAQDWFEHREAFQTQLLQLFQETPDVFILFNVVFLLIVGYSVTDAYLTAQRRNHRLSIKPPTHDS